MGSHEARVPEVTLLATVLVTLLVTQWFPAGFDISSLLVIGYWLLVAGADPPPGFVIGYWLLVIGGYCYWSRYWSRYWSPCWQGPLA